MENIKGNKILKFNDNQLVEVRKEFGYEHVDKMKQDIDLLEEWIQKQNHFVIKDFGRDYLERYLIYNKGSVERAKKRLDKLCTFRNLMPEFFQNIDIENDFKPFFNSCYTCFLPKPTTDNYRLIIAGVHGFDDRFDIADFFKLLSVSVEYMLCHDYNAGYEIIADSRNICLNLAKKINPITIHKGSTLLVEAMGMRLRHIHCISGSKFFDLVLSILRQGLTEKLRNRIVIHSSMESLYKYIPREILPKEYDGDEKSVYELTNDNVKEFSTAEHVERIKFMEKAVTDERLRLSCKFNEEYSGMPGSFKILSVD